MMSREAVEACLYVLSAHSPGGIEVHRDESEVVVASGVPRGWFGGSTPPPPRNSEDIVGVLDRMSKKNQRSHMVVIY